MVFLCCPLPVSGRGRIFYCLEFEAVIFLPYPFLIQHAENLAAAVGVLCTVYILIIWIQTMEITSFVYLNKLLSIYNIDPNFSDFYRWLFSYKHQIAVIKFKLLPQLSLLLVPPDFFICDGL